MSHAAEHTVSSFASPFMPAKDMICHRSRRWFLQTGLTGVAGLSLPALLAKQSQAGVEGSSNGKKSVILFWLLLLRVDIRPPPRCSLAGWSIHPHWQTKIYLKK